MTSPPMRPTPPTPPSGPAFAVPPPKPTMDLLFGRLWPERTLPRRPRLVLAALGVGVLAAVVLPHRLAGIGTFAVLMAVCGVVALADARLRTPYHVAVGVLVVLLASTAFVRDAAWVVVLCLLAAFAVGVVTLTGGRSLAGIVVSGTAVPLGALRSLPWVSRSLSGARPAGSWAPFARTAATSALLLLVFGLLFASADALFATWASALVPDLSSLDLGLRAVVLGFFAVLTLAGVYVALNPPAVEIAALPPGTPVRRPFEWLVPLGVVVATFAVFVGAQLTVMFGGHDYLRRTTGLTYADYVHQGFGQLTWATLLTLAVVGVTARKAARSQPRERLLLRAVLGVLCLLTLVVVASALYRMHVYEQAYGFTRLRLLVSFFEGWLGLVVVLVMVAGIRLRGAWVPRAALLTGAATLLVLAAMNPDAWIAQHNLDRPAAQVATDEGYLAGLSADAVPVLVDAVPQQVCADAWRSAHDDWLEWNLGRSAAQESLAGRC